MFSLKRAETEIGDACFAGTIAPKGSLAWE